MEKGLNAGKTKIMIKGTGFDILHYKFRQYPCTDKNSIYYNNCKFWVHKKSSSYAESGYTSRQTPNSDYSCAQRRGTAVLLTADRRVKFRSDLISWRWQLPSAMLPDAFRWGTWAVSYLSLLLWKLTVLTIHTNI